MTSATTPSPYIVRNNGQQAPEYAWKLFDKNDGFGGDWSFHLAGGGAPVYTDVYCELDFGSLSEVVHKYGIKACDPLYDWKFYGGTGTTFPDDYVELDSQSLLTPIDRTMEAQYFEIDNDTPYQIYRLRILRGDPGVGSTLFSTYELYFCT